MKCIKNDMHDFRSSLSAKNRKKSQVISTNVHLHSGLEHSQGFEIVYLHLQRRVVTNYQNKSQ